MPALCAVYGNDSQQSTFSSPRQTNVKWGKGKHQRAKNREAIIYEQDQSCEFWSRIVSISSVAAAETTHRSRVPFREERRDFISEYLKSIEFTTRLFWCRKLWEGFSPQGNWYQKTKIHSNCSKANDSSSIRARRLRLCKWSERTVVAARDVYSNTITQQLLSD